MATIRELITKITFKTDKGKLKAANVQIGKTKKRLRAAAKEAQKMRKNVNDLAFAMKAAFAGVVTGKIAKTFTTDVVDEIKEANMHAEALGEKFDRFAGFAVIAKKNKLETEDLADAMKEVAVKAKAAFIEGEKGPREFFKQLGLSKKHFVDTRGELKSTSEMLLAVADGYSKTGNKAQRAATIDDLLGDVGIRASKLLSLGREGIEVAIKQARATGEIWSEKTVAAALKYAKAKKQVVSAMIIVRNIIAEKLLPSIAANIQAFAKWVTEGNNLNQILAKTVEIAKLLAPALALVVLQMKKAAILQFGQSVLSAAKSLVLMGKAAIFAKGKLGLILIAALAIYDLIRLAQGQDSFLGRMFADSPETLAILKELGNDLIKLGQDLAKELLPVGAALMKELGGAFKAIWEAVKPLIPVLLKGLVGVVKILAMAIKAIAPLLGWVIKLFAKVIKWIFNILGSVFESVSDFLLGIGTSWEEVGDAILLGLNSVINAVGWLWDKVSAFVSWISKHLGPVFSEAAKAVKWAWSGIAAIFNAIKDTIKWIIDKTEAIIARMGKLGFKGVRKQALTGQTQFTGDELTALRRKHSKFGGVSSGIDQSVKVGTMPITVNAAPSMTPAELQRTVRDAAGEALQGLINDTYRGRAET
jgi:hypothetical protein